MKKIYPLLFVFFSGVLFSQENCETPAEENFQDLNSITKCSIKSSDTKKDSRQISVSVSASKNRFLKKRKIANANALNSSGVSKINNNNKIVNDLSLKKGNSSAIDLAKLSNKLSAEEVKKANRFSTVDEIPLFDACKSVKKKEALNCFNEQMILHIQEHFDYPSEAIINKIEGDVWVRFIIDKNGNVSNIKTLGPQGGKILDQEAIRVVSKLPKFIPGIKDGNKTSVKYGFPISFSLEN